MDSVCDVASWKASSISMGPEQRPVTWLCLIESSFEVLSAKVGLHFEVWIQSGYGELQSETSHGEA